MRVRGNRDGALGLLAAWLEKSRDDLESLRRLRELQIEVQQWEAVIVTCERLIVLDAGPEQEDAAMALLTAYETLGRPHDARAALEQARERQPASAKIRGALRRLYEAVGAHRELARLLIEEADVMEDPEQRIAYLRWAGQTLVMVGDVEAAVPALRKVLDLLPGDVGATVSLVDASIVAGQFDEADQLLDEAMTDLKAKRNTRDLPVFLHRKAHVARARGDAEQQLAFLQKAHQADAKNADIAAELADLAEALEQWEVALKALRAITLIETPGRVSQTQALIRQGRIALRQGDKKRAMMFARRAKRGDEVDPELEAFMREIGEG
jgi:tetratricopeptide (TPR) repeat protein